MTVTIFSTGLGGSTGAELAALEPVYTSGAVWYVDSVTGTDAAAPAGQNREKPLATIGQAHTNASNGDIVVLLETHEETVSGTIALSKELLFVGEGSAAGVPTVEIGFDATSAYQMSGHAQFQNVKFLSRTAAGAGPRISLASTAGLVDCYFECDDTDTGPAVQLANGANSVVLDGCTFVSIATDRAAQPSSAVKMQGTTFTDLVITDCVFSDGQVGFSNIFALDLSAALITRLEVRRLSLLLGAEAKIHASTTWRLAGLTTSGGGRLVW